MDGVQWYATPLLRRTPITLLHAGMEAVLPSLRNIETKLAKNPEQAQVYCSEIQKLESVGYIAKITQEEADKSTESWFIPHHMVHHNGKDRIVSVGCDIEVPATCSRSEWGHKRHAPPSTSVTW